MTDLFQPLRAGDLQLKNRIIMSPLTRARAGASRTPNDMMAEYYAQRASAGLIISEATAISPMGYGWKDAPGIYTDEHVAAWKKVTDAVHAKNGTMVLQLWHMGRVSHPDFLNGETPVAPSAIAAEGQARSTDGKKPYVIPRALSTAEVQATIQDYAKAARRAVDAGFDGIEIHGANGYLVDQFLKEGSNRRTDQYGGSIPNRARFLIEICEAIAAEIGAGRTGVHLSAINGYNSMQDDHMPDLFTYVAETLNPMNLSFIVMRESANEPFIAPIMHKAYKGVLVGNDSYEFDSADSAVRTGKLDAVAFGRKYIANPDLVERFQARAPLNDLDNDTLYSGGAEGYVDYPSLPHTRAA